MKAAGPALAVANAVASTSRSGVVTIALIAVLGIVAAAPPVRAQGERASRRERGDPWAKAVDAHQPGRADASVQALATMSATTIEMGMKRAIGAGEFGLLARGLALHTDGAVMDGSGKGGRREAWETSVPGMAGPSTLVEDGQAVGARPRSAHWTYATQLAIALARIVDVEPRRPDEPRPPTPAQRLAALWFRTISALCQQRGELGLEEDTTSWGLHLFPDDPDLLLARGTVHQAYADGRVQRFVKGHRATAQRALAMDVTKISPGRPALPPGPQDAAAELALAEADFRRALALAPDLREARVRLAHVLTDRGGDAEAATLARDAIDHGLPAFFEVYASLILGRSSARLGRLGEARLAFARAAELAPDAQTPRIGLAQVALAEGKPASALAELTPVSAPDRVTQPDDEWLSYFRVHDPGPRTLFLELWRQVTAAPATGWRSR
jgi:hypothetical protein